jgi:hypothetical protein
MEWILPSETRLYFSWTRGSVLLDWWIFFTGINSGHELRNVEASKVIREFIEKLEKQRCQRSYEHNEPPRGKQAAQRVSGTFFQAAAPNSPEGAYPAESPPQYQIFLFFKKILC